MQVKMRTAAANARYCAQPGQVISVEDAEGQALIDGGYAEAFVDQDELSARKALLRDDASEGKPAVEGDEGEGDAGEGDAAVEAEKASKKKK